MRCSEMEMYNLSEYDSTVHVLINISVAVRQLRPPLLICMW